MTAMRAKLDLDAGRLVRFLSLAMLCALTAHPVQGATAPVHQPNFVIIFTDDQGYQDVGCFGSPLIKTPQLDRMAAEGRRFTSFYVAANVCSPSRGALLTGRYPLRMPIRGVYFPRNDNGMPLSEITLAQVLKEQGYATGCVGKWHLGHKPQYLPTERGFDSYFGVPYSNDMWLDPGIPPAEEIQLRDGKSLEDYRAADRHNKRSTAHQVPLMRQTEAIEWPADQSTLTRRYTEEAMGFIQANKDRPFFLYLAHTMPHIPLFASPDFEGKSARGLYGDTIEEIDWSVGRILQLLRDLELDQRTFVLFTSDNGPWLVMEENGGSATPLRDGKGTTYEGGQRVPCIMWWPGKIPAGTQCDELASTLDLMPTLSRLAGGTPPADPTIDGHNIWPLMIGAKDTSTPYPAFFYGTEAVRAGSWKYRKGPEYGSWVKKREDLENRTVEQLFNLDEDIGEMHNLIDQHPEKAETLRRMLREFTRDLQRHQRPS